MQNFTRVVLVIGVVAASLGVRAGVAQTDTGARAQTPAQAPKGADRWQLTVDSTEYIWDVRLVQLVGDTLIVRQADSLVRVRVSRISEIRRLQKSTMREGAIAQGAMAALTGADDEIYDLEPLNFAERLRVIRKLLLYHPPQ